MSTAEKDPDPARSRLREACAGASGEPDVRAEKAMGSDQKVFKISSGQDGEQSSRICRYRLYDTRQNTQ